MSEPKRVRVRNGGVAVILWKNSAESVIVPGRVISVQTKDLHSCFFVLSFYLNNRDGQNDQQSNALYIRRRSVQIFICFYHVSLTCIQKNVLPVKKAHTQNFLSMTSSRSSMLEKWLNMVWWHDFMIQILILSYTCVKQVLSLRLDRFEGNWLSRKRRPTASVYTSFYCLTHSRQQPLFYRAQVTSIGGTICLPQNRFEKCPQSVLILFLLFRLQHENGISYQRP